MKECLSVCIRKPGHEGAITLKRGTTRVITACLAASLLFVYQDAWAKSPTWNASIFHKPVWTASGKVVHLNAKRPILFIAPWCPHCAAQEKLFEKWKLSPGDFQVVVLASWAQNQVKKMNPATFRKLPTITWNVNSAQAEKKVLMLDEAYDGIHYINPNQVYYEIPQGFFDNTIPEYPYVLYGLTNKGNIQSHAGVVTNRSFWGHVISHQ